MTGTWTFNVTVTYSVKYVYFELQSAIVLKKCSAFTLVVKFASTYNLRANLYYTVYGTGKLYTGNCKSFNTVCFASLYVQFGAFT